jgi:hypothetical protein
MLESPHAVEAEIHNKENHDAHHGDEIGELADPFAYAPQQGSKRNPYNKAGGSMNPYNQHKPFSSSLNPYRQAYPQQQGSFSQNTGQVVPRANCTKPSRIPPSNDVSPTLTQDQIQRMEENRQRALAIRMKRQQGLS